MRAPSLGLESGTVRLVPHDPAWAELFEAEALVRAGYVHRGERGIPGREFFRRGEPRSYHLHLVVRDGTFWREHLAFRDALRAEPATREAYAALKLELARRHPRDREAYTEGKGDFVRRVVAEAAGHGPP